MIKLIVYPRTRDPRLINNSPFCSKTEIYLRLAGIDFSIAETQIPTRYPNKKLPVINDSGTVIADSSLIESYCNQKYSINLNRELSSKDNSIGYAFSKMMEEYLYWAALCERWLYSDNWTGVRDTYFSSVPIFARVPLGLMVRNSLRKAAVGHGMARHSYDEILSISSTGITAIASFLDDKEYFMGDRVSSYDSTAYGFISNLLYSDFNPEMQKQVQSHNNLTSYCERMYHLVFMTDSTTD